MHKICSLILISIFVVSFIHANEKNNKNLYDIDSLAVIALLDSNNYSHDNFWYIVWDLIKVTVNDSDWRIARLYLKKDSLPAPLFCIPPVIEKLERLVSLTIPHHNVDKLPKEIGNMQWMQVIDLRYNPINEIPVEIAQCPLFRYLGLAHTNVTSLPDEFIDIDVLKPINIAVDTINGNIYPHGIDLCGLENFTLTESQKVWADVADYVEYEEKYCQQTEIVIPEKKHKLENLTGIAVKVKGYSIELTLEREGLLSLSLFDSRGKKIRTIIDKKAVSKGSYTIQMDRNISAGVYFLRGRFSGVVISKKVIIEGGI